MFVCNHQFQCVLDEAMKQRKAAAAVLMLLLSAATTCNTTSISIFDDSDFMQSEVFSEICMNMSRQASD